MKQTRSAKLSDHRREILWIAGALLISRLIAGVVLPRYDDAFITMRYARNLAQGLGFVFNPGEHVLGETCPGFGLLQSLFFLLHLPMPEAVLALNILTDVGVFWLSAGILVRAGYEKAIIPFGLLFALNPILSRICVGCMEVDLNLLLGLWAISAYQSKRKYLAVSIAAVSYFLRPESVALVALLCILEVANHAWKRAVLMGSLALAIVAGPVLWIYAYYGSIIAQSVTAKAAWAHSSYFRLFHELVFNDPLQFVLFGPFVYALFLVRKQRNAIRTLGLLALIQIVLYAVYRTFIFNWYGETIHFAVCLLGSIGLVELLERYALPWLRILKSRWVPPISAAVIVLLFVAMLAKMGPSPTSQKVYAAMQQWFGSHPVEGRTILAGDIGAIGYYSDAYIYDSDGLVWRDAAKYHSQLEIIHTFEPDFLLLNASGNLSKLLSDTVVAGKYKRATEFSPEPIDVSSLSKDWTQRYVLYEKRR